MEPEGGNFYRPHPLQINSGTFWRCEHGRTGLDGDLNYIGCKDCAWEIGLKTWFKFYVRKFKRMINN